MESVKAQGGRAISLTLYLRMDETPMRVCVLDLNALYGLPEAICKALEGLFTEECDRNDGVAKILQYEVTIVALTKVRSSYRLWSWCVPTPTQTLGRGTAECYVLSRNAMCISE